MKKDILKVKKNTVTSDIEVRFEHQEALTVLVIKILAPFAMMVCGLILLALRLAGWSIIIGLPITIIGIVLLIYAYDEIVSKKIVHNHDDLDNTTEEEE